MRNLIPNRRQEAINVGELAITGGKPVRTKSFPAWPQATMADERAVAGAVRERKWGIGGKRTAAFERKFADYVGAKYGATCANGTAALIVALLAGGIEEGAEVVVPAYTFIATPMAAVWCNATPVFADLDPETLNLDPEAAAATVTNRTQAVIPVHFGGIAADMTRFNALARKRKLHVVEDACHAQGAEYKGRRCGSLGHIAAFSFQSSKNITSGEGGFISTNSAKLDALARAFIHVGRLKNGGWYEHAIPGVNFRITDLQSALLLSQMCRLDRQTARRDRNGLYLARELSKIEGIFPQKRGREITRASYHLFMFRVDAERFPVPRDRFLEVLRAEGIPCSGGYPIPLYRQQVFLAKDFGPYAASARRRRDVSYARVHLPVTEKLCAECVWLYQSLLLGTRRDMQDVVRAIKKIRDHYRELL